MLTLIIVVPLVPELPGLVYTRRLELLQSTGHFIHFSPSSEVILVILSLQRIIPILSVMKLREADGQFSVQDLPRKEIPHVMDHPDSCPNIDFDRRLTIKSER